MKKFALIGLALALSACTLAGPPTADLVRGSRDPAVVGVAQDPQRLRFESGPAAATLNRLFITGAGLAVNDKACTAVGSDLECFPRVEVPAGRTYSLPIKGTNIHGTAYYTRPDGLGYAKTF